MVSSTRTNIEDNKRISMFEYAFDLNNNLTKLAVLTANGTNVTEYTYGKDNQPDTVAFNNGATLSYNYDTLGRNNKVTVNSTSFTQPIVTNYTYHSYSDGTKTYRSNLLHTEKSKNFKYRYTYDDRNNITKIEQGVGEDDNNLTYTTIEQYTYDALNQLTRVDYLTQNKRVVYTYDLGGNITREKIYSVADDGTTTQIDSISYSYGDINWKDKLTTYDGQAITYDNIGNPLTYRDGFTFSWSNGRQLQSLSKHDKTVNYTYDDSGIRLSKTVDGVEYTYLYKDQLLIQETVDNRILDYSYDANGELVMVRYRIPENNYDTSFYYALNYRGDVIGLYNQNGGLIAKYSYDVWGNVLSVTNATGVEITSSTHIALLQPFRYRSYYLDKESNFYYLQSRYYDPVTHRFINADGYVSTGTGILGHNMFAYCENNPVNYSDPYGESILSDVWSGFLDAYKDVRNNVESFFENTFGFGVVASQSYDVMSTKTVFFGNETGFSSTSVIHGDVSKPISIYVENASCWWKIHEYKIGLKVNLKNGSGFNYSYNPLEVTTTISDGNNSFTGIAGLNKIGYTINNDVNFANHSAGSYYHGYIRTIPTTLLGATIYYSGGCVGALLPVFQQYAFSH